MVGAVGISHQADEHLEVYALGRLGEPLLAEVEEHLLVCASCQERVDDLEAFALAMRRAAADEPSGPSVSSWFSDRFRSSNWKLASLAGAGALAVVVVVVGVYLHFRTNSALIASIELNAMRGEAQSIGQARETDITLADAPAALKLRAEVVDATGGAVWSGSFPSENHRIQLTKQLLPGSYFVRL